MFGDKYGRETPVLGMGGATASTDSGDSLSINADVNNPKIKDEILLLWLVGMLTTGFFESTRDNFRAWVEIINDLPDSVWYLLIIVFTATFSTKMTDKVLNRNKKK